MVIQEVPVLQACVTSISLYFLVSSISLCEGSLTERKYDLYLNIFFLFHASDMRATMAVQTRFCI